MTKLFNGKIIQLNEGDIQGTLYNSFNCDLSYNKGKLGIAPRTILTTDTITNMGVPIGFKYFDGIYFTVAGTKVFKNGGTPVGSFSQDGASGVPTDCSSDYSDIENFEDVLLVASNSELKSKAANGSGSGSYTLRRSFSGSAGVPHPICVYQKRAYWLDVTSPSRIYSMDTSFSVSTSGNYTTILPNEYEVISLRTHSNGIYILTINKYGGEGMVFDWNGISDDSFTRKYKIFAQGALAGYVDNDIPYIVNSNAELLKFNGGGFSVVANLPFSRNILYKATEITENDRFIHPNGLTSINGRISLLINSRLNNTTTIQYQDNIHSGIWEYDDEETLYHKYSLSYRTRPDQVGVTTDYGQINIARVGALAGTPDDYSSAETLKGNFLAGAQFYTDATSTGYGIWTDSYYDEVEKAGFFTTVQIRSENIEQMWNKVTTILNPTTDNLFVIKYRTNRETPVYFDITWTSQKSFTTTESTLAVGDEVTVIQGKGSGRCAHIESISGSGTYTVTLDQSFGIMSGTAKARKENWKKISTITSTSRKYDEAEIGEPDTWVELKVFMLGTGENVLVEDMVLDNVKQT